MTLMVVLLVTTAAHARATGSAAAACSAAEARQLDFWIGSWDLTGRMRTPDGWVETPATNEVRAALDGCVIEERFRMTDPDGLQGMSVSAYDARAREWRQTWVDNRGGYLVFRGGLADGRMTLSTTPAANAAGDTVVSRMAFSDIGPERLTWRWERSTDGGRSWTLLWTLEYRRRPS